MGNRTRPKFDMALQNRIVRSYYALATFYIVAGTVIAVCLIAAILTSRDLRQRLRNQLVCLVTLSDFLKSSVAGFLRLYEYVHVLEMRIALPCEFTTFFTFFDLAVEFVGSWYIVILIIVFISQITDFNPASTLTPKGKIFAKTSLFLLPCIVAIVCFPLIEHVNRPHYVFRNKFCLAEHSRNFIVFRILTFFIPVAICLVLLVVATVVYYRRFHRSMSESNSIRPEMLGRGPRVDNISAYVVVVGIDIACRFLYSIIQFHELQGDVNDRYLYTTVCWLIVDARSVLLPWGWLLLDDIRGRLRTWRPCRRVSPGFDGSVAYHVEENIGDDQPLQ